MGRRARTDGEFISGISDLTGKMIAVPPGTVLSSGREAEHASDTAKELRDLKEPFQVRRMRELLGENDNENVL